jgi:hypothetical protein
MYYRITDIKCSVNLSEQVLKSILSRTYDVQSEENLIELISQEIGANIIDLNYVILTDSH